MKTILYATDCSSNAGPSLRYAFRLSSAMKVHLHVLHVYELAPFVMKSDRNKETMELSFAEEQGLILKEFCNKKLEHEYGSKKLKLWVEENNSITAAILETAERIDADLVIVGIKDDQPLQAFFSENIGNKLLSKIQVPLLLLPKEVNFRGLSTLIYATDFEKSDIVALKKLVAFAEPYEALIKVVHIPRKKEIDFEMKMTLLEKEVKNAIDYPELVFCTKNAEDVESGLKHCVDEELPEMLVMLEREHGYWHERFFKKDMVEIMEEEVGLPILVFNKESIKTEMKGQHDETLFFTKR